MRGLRVSDKRRAQVESRHPVAFSVDVPAGSTAWTWLWWTVPQDATVEGLYLRIPTGPAGELWLRPAVHDVPGNFIYDLVTYPAGSVGYLFGDDMELYLRLREPVKGSEDQVGVGYWNNDAVNAHEFSLILELDYLGGLWPSGAGVQNG